MLTALIVELEYDELTFAVFSLKKYKNQLYWIYDISISEFLYTEKIETGNFNAYLYYDPPSRGYSDVLLYEDKHLDGYWHFAKQLDKTEEYFNILRGNLNDNCKIR